MIEGNDIRHVWNMTESISKIESYLNDIDEQEFNENELIRDAVNYHLYAIGHNVRKLSDEFKRIYNDIGWNVLSFISFDISNQLFFGTEFWEILKDNEDGLGKEFNLIKQVSLNLENYVFSDDVLMEDIQFNEFFNWFNGSGSLYRDVWLYVINEEYDLEFTHRQLKSKDLVDALIYINKKQYGSNFKMKKVSKYSYSIEEYMKAIEYIASKNSPFFNDSHSVFDAYKEQLVEINDDDKKERIGKVRWRGAEYSNPIKTSTSIWTVKKR